MNDPLSFLLAAFVLLAVPGPTNAALATFASVQSQWRFWPPVLAVTSGYLASTIVARLLLVPLVAAAPVVGLGLKATVIVYLAIIAVRLWRSGGTNSDRPAIGAGALFVITLLNPKGLILALVILPTQTPFLVAYFAVLAVLIVIVASAWLVLGRAISKMAGGNRLVVPRGGSLVLAGFAAYLATTFVI